MKKALLEIQSGKFAKEWLRETATGAETISAIAGARSQTSRLSEWANASAA